MVTVGNHREIGEIGKMEFNRELGEVVKCTGNFGERLV
jgi:hypothetical protein